VALQCVDLDDEGPYSKQGTRGTHLVRFGYQEGNGLRLATTGGSSVKRRSMVVILRGPLVAVKGKTCPVTSCNAS
jgi:hypothetical protein